MATPHDQPDTATPATEHKPRHRTWQHYALAAVPLLSMSLLACLPFIIATRRGTLGWKTSSVYTALSATVLGFAIVQPHVNGWFAVAVWAYILTATAHTLRLDLGQHPTK
ncbi:MULTISPECIES: hypothetical protein [unclassified Streptomyces]|uniref:hypothetical protein n=1 Tax=unclassified Streptomyces TaxID=2593676 RepID=UPI0033FFE4BD